MLLLLLFARAAVPLAAEARAVAPWSDDELLKGSDLVVVGLAVEVRDLDETNSNGPGAFRDGHSPATRVAPAGEQKLQGALAGDFEANCPMNHETQKL